MSKAAEISHHSRGTLRVLLADADHSTRELYRDPLRRAGCDVVEATDGREALVEALSHRPTLVITDARLPMFDGYALCDVLRRDSMTRAVPILMLTTDTRPKDLDRARHAGADGVLIKPVAPEALLKEIQRLLRHLEQPHDAAVAAPVATAHRRKSLAQTHVRFDTTTPPTKPPDLLCPLCGTPLVYERSHLGGVSIKHPERWDDYMCPMSCGPFIYRHRTRKLRHGETSGMANQRAKVVR